MANIKYTIAGGDLPLGIELDPEGMVEGLIYFENLVNAPLWSTPAGVIGTFDEDADVNLGALSADAIEGRTVTSFTTIARKYDRNIIGLPWGLQMNTTTGAITGKLSYGLPNSISPGLPDEQPIWITEAQHIGSYDEAETLNFTMSATDFEGEPVEYSVVNGYIPWGLTFSTTAGTIQGTIADLKDPRAPVESKANGPTWNTIAGYIGSYSDAQTSSITLQTTPYSGRSVTRYAVQSGKLPWGMTIANNGVISGMPASSGVDEPFASVSGFPVWETLPGTLGSFNELTPINITFKAIKNTASASVSYSVIKGYIPWGSLLDMSTGVLSGTLGVIRDPLHPFDNFQAPVWQTASTLAPVERDVTVNTTVVCRPFTGKSIAYYSSEDLPTGLTLNTANGALTGVLPFALGDNGDFVQSRTPPVWPEIANDLGTFDDGEAFTRTFTTTPVSGTVTYELTKGYTPWGLTLTAAGVLAGTFPLATHNRSPTTTPEATPHVPVWSDIVVSGTLYIGSGLANVLIPLSATTSRSSITYSIVSSTSPMSPVTLDAANNRLIASWNTEDFKGNIEYEQPTAHRPLLGTPSLTTGTSSTTLEGAHLGTYARGATIAISIPVSGGTGSLLEMIIGGYLPWGLTADFSARRISGAVAANATPGTYSFKLAYMNQFQLTAEATFNIVIV